MAELQLITLDDFEKLLPKICNVETSLDAEGWSEDNPLWGQCEVVSLVAQNLFGGKLLRASLEGTPYAEARSHYWNELPNGEQRDFTAAQFTEGYPEGLEFVERTKAYAAGNSNTANRFTKLTLRLAEKVMGENPLFQDSLYERCITKALTSPCKKLGFGSLIVYDGEIVSEAYNGPIEGLKDLCEPDCIRIGIQSRTESMLGACGHAEEWVMQEAREKGINLKESDLYVAGMKSNGMPWIKKEESHSCLRCSVQMDYAGLKSINVPVKNGWAKISTSDALNTSKNYALGSKKI